MSGEEKYLFVFGYETPVQKIINYLDNHADEDSMALIILAKDKLHAEKWGRTIAKHFLKQLYSNSVTELNINDYVSWAELLSETNYRKEDLEDLCSVKYDEMPNIGQMLEDVKK